MRSNMPHPKIMLSYPLLMAKYLRSNKHSPLLRRLTCTRWTGLIPSLLLMVNDKILLNDIFLQCFYAFMPKLEKSHAVSKACLVMYINVNFYIFIVLRNPPPI